MEINKVLPNSERLEAFVLGSFMQAKSALDDVKDIVSEKIFYNPFHAELYKVIASIDESGGEPDIMAVVAEMEKKHKGSMAKVIEISETYGYDVYQHVEELVEKHNRRELINLSFKINSLAFNEAEPINEILSAAEDAIKEIASDKEAKFSMMSDAIKSVFEQVDRNHATASGPTGTPTGFEKLDRRAGGLQKSDLIIIAADTSQGKTSLSVSIVLNAATSGSSIAMYSMEMKKEQIAARMMSIKSGVPANQILYSKMLPEQFEAIDRGIASLYDRKIYFDDRSTSNIDTIISSIRTLKKRYNIDGVVVDYLQILNVNMKGSSPEQQMGSVARRLKNLAKELDIWIIALSQLSRDNQNPVPSLSRLRDSGQIGEAADVVILIYRPEVYGRDYYPEPFKGVDVNGTAMIDVAKGRNIGLLKFICGFDKQTTRFYDVSETDCVQARRENEPF